MLLSLQDHCDSELSDERSIAALRRTHIVYDKTAVAPNIAAGMEKVAVSKLCSLDLPGVLKRGILICV